MYAYKDVAELAGYTTRLYTLLSTLHHIPIPPPPTVSQDTVALTNVDVVIPGRVESGEKVDTKGEGEDDVVEKDMTENLDAILVRDLSFSLKVGTGEHLMITGTNGVGKTAIARVVAGLWAGRVDGSSTVTDGGVTRPPVGVSEVFVVPQRAYMVTGTLLDQLSISFTFTLLYSINYHFNRVIYPHSYTQFLQSGRTEAELMQILESVHLAYLPAREGGWATRKEWRDVLSGGEKQRMGLARVMYHRPKFALLDGMFDFWE
jgi:ATP-binding cassette subfamily D (ALD) long-chain fatty acid import protein